MLGSAADAEDVVQEAWLRWAAVEHAAVADARAYLMTVVTRAAIDRARREASRRTVYVGPWLPEPVPTSDPAESVELVDSLSIALLVVLETLSPLERAVYVLHEAFALPHGEIAEILGRSPAAVRQLAHRARGHVAARRPRFPADQPLRRAATERFLRACQHGDVDALLEVLAPDAVFVADGGGQAPAPRQPIYGAAAVVKFLLGLARSHAAGTVQARIAPINGGPTILIHAGPRTVAVFALDLDGDRVRTVHAIANPAKLQRIRPD